jgi:hypothetical protein
MASFVMMAVVQNSTTVAVVRMVEDSSELLDAIIVVFEGFLGGGETGQCLAIGQLVKCCSAHTITAKDVSYGSVQQLFIVSGTVVYKSLCSCL